MHERHFQTERRRFAVDAVAATDARREFMFQRAAGDDGQKFFDVGDQKIRALRHLHGVTSIADVAAREAEMKPAARIVIDRLGDGGGETDDVVVEGFFFAKSLAGTIFSFTNASLASSSICSQIFNLFSSVQIARISGRE